MDPVTSASAAGDIIEDIGMEIEHPETPRAVIAAQAKPKPGRKDRAERPRLL